MHEKTCEICNQQFNTHKAKQATCSLSCADRKRIKKINENWINKKTKPVDEKNRSKFETNHLHTDSGWLKKFNSVRG